ncbi:MAG: hypothetical protein ACFFDD_10330 [Promethearchaeota archaeon]
MKRVLALLVIMVAILAIPPSAYSPPDTIENKTYPQQGQGHLFSTSSASGTGDSRAAIVFASRQINSLSIDLANSYTSTSVHSWELDLSNYLIPGWSLYEVDISANSITAIAERETMGIVPNDYIKIENNSGIVTDALYQEFYRQPHDGKLENYSFTYTAPYYDSSTLGNAYLVVRSNYSDPQTNTTSWITPFTLSTNTVVTHDCSGDSAILNASESYYVVIDGTSMTGIYYVPPIDQWEFNTIWWRARWPSLGLDTGRSIRNDDWYSYVGGQQREAELNYTYTPWNGTANSPLTYSSPASISLKGNASELVGTYWAFTDSSNITAIKFDSNQSVNINYNLTLWYKQTSNTTTDWNIPSSGADVEWSVETTIEFPMTTQAKYLNISIPRTWDPDGLYNSTHSSNNHTTFTSTGTIVTCSQMYNETWTLKLTSENLMKTLKTYTTIDDTEVATESIMTSDIDINSTIQEPDTDPVTTGTVSLEIWHSGSEFWTPSDKSVTNGLAHYYWNISNPLTTNGQYTIETHWSNGTEAGYLSKTLLLYYPTSMVADSYNIDAFTESAFDIRVDITDTFTPQGLNGTYLNLVYSFDGAANQSMTDLNNGTWSATVSTAGKTFGDYNVLVYATGYAIQNRSLQINASLIHDTESLTIQWSNTNDITFIESTELSVAYNRVGGTPIAGATVNITINSIPYELTWNGTSETYKRTFLGSDILPGFGVHSLDIQAWKEGHKLQTDDAQTLTIQEEPTTLDIQWSNGNNITYVNSTTLIANFTMSDGSPVLGAWINVTIGSNTWNLTWNGLTEVYEYVFDGDADPPGFGNHSLTIVADKFGYVQKTASSETLVLREEPTSLVLTWSANNNITYVEETYLYANYTMSNGTAVVGATVNVTIDTQPWTLDWHSPTQTYRVLFTGSADPPGLGTHNIVVLADLFGYELQNNNTEQLILREEPTTLVLSWSNGHNITYVESTTLIANFTMSDNSPVLGAWINVTIGSNTWNLTWNGLTEVYEYVFDGDADPPGLDTHSATITAYKFGYEYKSTTSVSLTFREEPTTLVLSWSNENNITYIESTTLIANFTMTNGSAVYYALVTVTIGVDSWELDWHEASKTYRMTFLGMDDPPGLGTFSFTVEASRVGFENQTDTTEDLTLRIELTSLELQWWLSDTITYVGQTVLYANYTMSNGSAIVGAYVTAVIGLENKTFEWNSISEVYSLILSGSDPAYELGNHSVTVQATLYGYQQQNDNSQTLRVLEESTTLTPSWSPDNNITFVEITVLSVRYDMGNGSAISGATVIAFIGPDNWTLIWNSGSGAYEYTFSGLDAPPGLGNHSLLIQASRYGFVNASDSSQFLKLNLESTDIQVSWSNGNSPSYFDYTYLFVDYRMSNFTSIKDAELNVTIDTSVWTMKWNESAGMYQVRFNGSDYSPGVGTHNLLIQAWKFGYIPQMDDTETLTLPVIPTLFDFMWTNTNDITFVEQTTILVNYTLFNGTIVLNATVTASISTRMYTLRYNEATGLYEETIYGTDDPPGFGVFTIYISAWKSGFQLEAHLNIEDTFTITKEPTSLIITWSNSNNITYVTDTTLSVRYVMSNLANISGAVLNVTINGHFQTLTWNSSSNAYEATIRGDDDPPGYGTYTVDIQAWKFGFIAIHDTTQTFTIRLEDTSVSYEWIPNSTITYVGQTTIRISYLMNNGTPIPWATVNITRGPQTWDADWNETSKAYEYTWLGSDDPPGLGSHPLLVQAWKTNYVAIIDTTQTLTIDEEPTSIQASWSNGNIISYTEWTTLLVNYTTSSGTVIPFALVDVTIGSDNWVLDWNGTSQLYEITFRDSTPIWPGLGTHGLSIRGWLFGYETTVNNTQTLTILSEQVNIKSVLLEGNTITYVGFTTLEVNYTTTEGIPISGATVNVTIGEYLWDLKWHATSETYRIRFNGTDDPPGLGNYNLIVNASALGFDPLTDSSQFLTIVEEPTSLNVYWSAPNFNNVTYYDYTFLFVEYKMSNGDPILDTKVNVTFGVKTWTLDWNSTQGVYSLRFNGSDSPPGLGTHSLTIKADKFGFVSRTAPEIMLTLSKDPTTLGVSWIGGNDITYVESTILSVTYKMSNGSDITGALVNATIGGIPYFLSWNGTAGAYQYVFEGNQDPPGLGSFTVFIQASADVYVPQTDTTSLAIQNEGTTATPSPPTITFDWTQSVIFSVDYKDTYGTLIYEATTKDVYIDGAKYKLLGTNGTYWFEFNNTFDLGFHDVWANFSKFGYDVATPLSINFTIIEAPTALSIVWDSATIDYLGQANLTVDYYYTGSGTSVPSAGVLANMTIDGSIFVELILQETLWVANLTGDFLDLGVHSIVIRASVYGYEYSETTEFVTVNEVATDSLIVSWTPFNVTIEYIDSYNLTVDYTYYRGDVPSSAIVNVTISGIPYTLSYSGGFWGATIPGSELGIGLHTATISAWLYGYSLQTNVTADLNVTAAANSFLVTWEPWDLDASYIDIVNASVLYTQDFQPILGATIQLTINGTQYLLTYSVLDEMWHFSMRARDIGLGTWNVTMTANKTGYADGLDSRILTISPAATNLTVLKTSTTIYFDEAITLDIYYQLLNTSVVPGAILTLEVDGVGQSAVWNSDHWIYSTSGSGLGLGIHSFYVNVEAFGFHEAVKSFDVNVTSIPTTLDVKVPTLSVLAHESLTFTFTWLDTKNSVGLFGAIPIVVWLDIFSIVDHGNGTYSIEIDSENIHVGFYDLNVTFSRTGYDSTSHGVTIEILEIPISMITETEISQYENETIVIIVQLYHSVHATPLDWATLSFILEGRTYTMVYDSGNQEYVSEILLHSSIIAPGTYSISINATAMDCTDASTTVELTVLPKTMYTLSIDTVTEIDRGEDLTIEVEAIDSGSPVEDLLLTVYIAIYRDEGAPQIVSETITTNSEGTGHVEFVVPDYAISLRTWAEFSGSLSEWSAKSNTIEIAVRTPRLEFGPMMLTLFGGGIFAIIIVIVGILRRRRSG